MSKSQGTQTGALVPHIPEFASSQAVASEQVMVGDTAMVVHDDNLRGQMMRLDAIGRRNLSPDPGPVPTHVELTNKDCYTEPFLPIYAPEILRGNGVLSPRSSVMGRVLDIDINTAVPTLGGPDETTTQLCIADRAWIQDEIVMRTEVNAAREQNRFSPYEELVDGNGDVFFVWEVDRRKSALGKVAGSLVLRSIVSEVHAEDIYIQYAQPMEARKPTGDYFEYSDGFADFESYRRDEKWFANLERGIQSPNNRGSRRMVREIAAKIIDPSLKVSAASERLYTIICNHQGETAEPARTILRAEAMFNHYDAIEKERGHNAKRDLNKARQRVWFGLGRMKSYLDYIAEADSAFNSLRVAYPDRDLDSIARFEIIAFDDIDMDILKTAKHHLDKFKNDEDTPGVMVLRELIGHLADGRDRDHNLLIRALGRQNRLRFLNNLSPKDSSSKMERGRFLKSTSMPYVAQGHYGDELLASLVAPEESKYFPANGLAMSGVVTAFDVITPEQTSDPHEPTPQRFVVTSAKQGPAAVSEAILRPYFAGGSKQAQVLSQLLSGEIEYFEIMTRNRPQRWELLVDAKPQEPGDYRRMEIARQTFRNGDAFAIATFKGEDGQTRLYFDRGKIDGQKPKDRAYGQRRSKPSRRVAKMPRYTKSQHTGRVPNANGGYDNNILLDTRFVDGAIYVQDTASNTVTTAASPNFRRVVEPSRKKARK